VNVSGGAGLCAYKQRYGIEFPHSLLTTPISAKMSTNKSTNASNDAQAPTGSESSQPSSSDSYATAGSDYHPDNNTATIVMTFNPGYKPYKKSDGDFNESNLPALLYIDGTPTADRNLCRQDTASEAAQTICKIVKAYKDEIDGWIYHHPNGPDPENTDFEIRRKLQAGWEESKNRLESYVEFQIDDHNDYDSKHGSNFPLVLAKSRVGGQEPLSISKIRRASIARAFVDNTIYVRLTKRGDPGHGKTFSPFDGEAPEDFGITIYGTRRGKERLGGKNGVPTADAIRSLDDRIAWNLKDPPWGVDEHNSPYENESLVQNRVESGFQYRIGEFNKTKEGSAFPLTAVRGSDLNKLKERGYDVKPLGLRDCNGRGRNPCRGGRNPWR
jgi:hypothetical protein